MSKQIVQLTPFTCGPLLFERCVGFAGCGKDHIGYDRYIVDTGRCFPYFAKHYYCSICLPVCVYNHREWARDFEGFQTGWFPEVVMTEPPAPADIPEANRHSYNKLKRD